VEVPRHVRLDGVEPHEPGLADPIRPQIGVHPEVVERATDDLHRTTVEHVVVLANLKRGHDSLTFMFIGADHPAVGRTEGTPRDGRRTVRPGAPVRVLLSC